MKKRKIKGLIPAIFVFIICALYSAFTVFNRFTAIGLSYESTADCVIEGIHYIIYLVAYVLGLIYLFKKNRKFALYSSIVYVLAVVYQLADELISGYYSAENIIVLVIQLVAYILTVIIISKLIKGQTVKVWYLPSLVLLLTGLVESIITEINDTHGFDFSLVLFDVAFTIIMLLPMFMLTYVVKEDTKTTVLEETSK